MVRTVRCLAWLLALAGAAAAGGNAMEELGALEAALEAARIAGVESPELEARIPPWARLDPRFDGVPPPADAEGLRAVLAGAAPARTKALAALRLATAGDPADLAPLAALAGSTAEAGAFPGILYATRVDPTYPVSWEPATLGQMALAALSALAGHRFRSPDDWTRWHAAHPDPLDSIEWWKARSSAAGPAGAAGILDSLFASRPLVYARRMIQDTSPDPPASGAAVAPEVARAEAVLRAALGPDGIDQVLTGGRTWPELADETAAGRAKDWLLARYPALAGRAAPARLAALFAARDRIRPEWVHERLALVLAEADPGRAVAVLAQVLDEKPRGEMAGALAALAAADPAGQAERLEGWFRDGATAYRTGNRVAILAGLGAAGPAARPVLARLLGSFKSHAETEELAPELVAAAKGLGSTDLFPLLPLVGHGPVRKKAEDDAAAARTEARAQKARADCVARVRAFLGLPAAPAR